jgi:hypothetical protein
MSERNTLVRSLHDVGLAAWFGGSLMGAVGLNGATAQARDPQERLRLSSAGWGRWAPVNATAVAVHAIGGVGLIVGNKSRLGTQSEARGNTVVKAALTGVAAAVTAYSGALGRKVSRLSHEGGSGATEPSAASSPELASAQRQLRVTQWAIPALTGVLLVLGAQQGEQQRPVAGFLGR